MPWPSQGPFAASAKNRQGFPLPQCMIFCLKPFFERALFRADGGGPPTPDEAERTTPGAISRRHSTLVSDDPPADPVGLQTTGTLENAGLFFFLQLCAIIKD